MRTINNNGIGIRNVYSIFYNGSRKQYVIVVIGKIKDDLLQFLWFHLSMTNSHTSIWHIFQYHFLQARQIIDARIDEIDLTIARHFKVNGICYDFCAKSMDLRLDRITVRRWCLNDTQVASTHQRELQRTWNRRCRHGQRINIGLHLAQLLFRRNAKLLFLVDNEQSQVVKLHRLTNQLMRTY